MDRHAPARQDGGGRRDRVGRRQGGALPAPVVPRAVGRAARRAPDGLPHARARRAAGGGRRGRRAARVRRRRRPRHRHGVAGARAARRARVRRAAARAGGVDHRGGDRARRAAHGLQRRRQLLLARLADTFVGIAVGLAVNVAVWPPLRDRVAARRIDELDDRLGALLAEMAGELRECRDDARSGRAGSSARASSTTASTRRGPTSGTRARAGGSTRAATPRGASATRADLGDVLAGLEQAVADTRSMARTIGRAGAIAEVGAGVPRRVDRILGRAAARR